ncbi:MAG: thermonuclease family protein, partial [Bacilli bacterium]
KNMYKKIISAWLAALLFLSGCGEPVEQQSTEKPTEQLATKPEQETKPEAQTKPEQNNNANTSQKDEQLPSHYVQKPIGPTFTATVVKVTDGDTIKIKFSGKEESVRLLLIDTPESVHPSKPVQPFGIEASNFAKEFFPIGSEVEVDIDVSERDKYGRLLAYIWKDGVLYQDKVLEAGLARVAYVYAPNTSYVDSLRANEAIAKKKRIGIWSIEDYAANNFETDEEVKKPEQPTTSEKMKIKGNINSKGEKIYHMPGQAYYDRTNPEEVFSTEQEAIKAGYRKSQR